MRLLISLVGAQGDSIARALQLGRRLREKGHELTFLGEFIPAVEAELAGMQAASARHAQADDFDAGVLFSLGVPDRLTAVARKLPCVLMVQESQLELMSLKGDFVHWVSLFRAVRMVVFLTEHQRDKVFASFTSGIDPSRLLVWPCGPAAAACEPRPAVSKDFFGVVTCCGLGQHSRVQDLIAAGERLRDFNLQFSFVGDRQLINALPEGLRKVVQRHPDRYTFTGALSPAQTLEVIRRHDLYCQATVDDVWPQAIMDAAASGLPLMLSDIEPFARDWINGINCLKFPLNRPDFMASLLRMLLQDDVLRNSLSMASQATVKKFPVDRYTAQAVALVESLKK